MVSLSAASGHVAALRDTGTGSFELLAGTGVGLTPVAGVAPLPGDLANQPRVHVGSDSAGRPVIVYPRCPGMRRTSDLLKCDLRVFDVESGRDRLAAGVRRKGRGEYEGVMIRGALAYAASGPTTESGDSGSGLWYRQADGRQSRIAHIGGWDLAMRGGDIAHVISDGGKYGGEEPCINNTLVMRSTRGAAPKVLARQCLYPYGVLQGWTSPTFIGGDLVWANRGGAPNLFRLDLHTKAVAQARIRGTRMFAFQATSATAGLAIVTSPARVGPEADDDEAGDSVVVLDPVVWKPRKSTLAPSTPYDEPDLLR